MPAAIPRVRSRARRSERARNEDYEPPPRPNPFTLEWEHLSPDLHPSSPEFLAIYSRYFDRAMERGLDPLGALCWRERACVEMVL